MFISQCREKASVEHVNRKVNRGKRNEILRQITLWYSSLGQTNKVAICRLDKQRNCMFSQLCNKQCRTDQKSTCRQNNITTPINHLIIEWGARNKIPYTLISYRPTTSGTASVAILLQTKQIWNWWWLQRHQNKCGKGQEMRIVLPLLICITNNTNCCWAIKTVLAKHTPARLIKHRSHGGQLAPGRAGPLAGKWSRVFGKVAASRLLVSSHGMPSDKWDTNAIPSSLTMLA